MSFVIACLAGFVAACPPHAHAGVAPYAAHAPSTSGTLASLQPARDSAGAVLPGDRLILRVWREPSWSDSLVVDMDGRVVLPRVGPFRVAGLRPATVADSVRARFAVYLRDPVVDVLVLRRVAVLGAVRKPDVYFVDPTTSLRQVLAQAGGLDEDGDPNRVEVVRDGVRQRLGRWAQVAESALPARSGDQLIVGRRSWITRNATATVSTIAIAASVIISAVRR